MLYNGERMDAFRMYSFLERGIRRSSLFGSSEIRYEEVAELTFAANRRYVKGAYAGTQVSMTLRGDEPRRKLSFSARVDGRNEDIEGAPSAPPGSLDVA